MKKPSIPNNEELRLRELYRLKVLDTKPEAEFDEITRLVATICDVKIALISLVDEKRQWFKSRFGLEATETPRDISFCGHAILTDKVFEVPNAELHPDFCDNPLFLAEPHVRFYAGAPLITKNGFRIGTLCVIDNKEKNLNEIQKKTLAALAKQVVGILELKVTQAEVQFTNDQLERAQATAKIGSWQFDLRTHEQWWSNEHYRIFEIEHPQPQDVLHKLYRERIHPDDLPRLDHLVERAVNHSEDFVYDHRVRLDGGQRIKYVQGIGKVVKDSSGKPVLINGTCQDMTISYLLKEAEAFNTFYKVALDEAAIVAMTDAKGKINHDFKIGFYVEQQDRFHIKDQLIGIESQKLIYSWLTQFGAKLGKEGLLLPYFESYLQLNKAVFSGFTFDIETKYKNYSDTKIITLSSGFDVEKIPRFVFVLRTYLNNLEYKRRNTSTINFAGMIKAQYEESEKLNLYLGIATGQEAIVISYLQGIKNYTYTSSFIGVKNQFHSQHSINLDYNKTTYENISSQIEKISILYEFQW